jgi:thiol-disulfide isomerase/thioredoxin
MRRAFAALLLLAATACSPSDVRDDLGPPDVDVDTTTLRTIKEHAGIADCVPGSDAPVKGGLPKVTLPCLGGGKAVDLSTLRGPLVVNLWASWCAPCRRELPIYQDFAEAYDGRVDVLGIDFNDVQSEAALTLAGESGVTYPQLADPGAELDGAGTLGRLLGLPILVLVDRAGKVVFHEPREIKSLDELTDLVAQHLGVAP